MGVEALAFAANFAAGLGVATGEGEPIRVSLGGWFTIGCHVFVDDRLIHTGS